MVALLFTAPSIPGTRSAGGGSYRLEWVVQLLRRLLSAVKRTLLGLLPLLAVPDDPFAERRLSAEEYRLFLAMDRRERHHGCAVARALLRRRPDAPPLLVRAALLHDVGKSCRPYRVWQRILVHLYTPQSVPSEPRYPGFWGEVQAKVHHPTYGAQMILAAGGCGRVASLVERHHDPAGDPDAEWLRLVDDGI